MANDRFEKRLKQIQSEIWVKIARIDELKGRWNAGVKLSPQLLGRLKRSVLVTSSGASTRIEGARLSDDEVEKLMVGIDIQKFADRDSQEVRGYFELLQNVFDSWQSIKFGESTIRHFHQELLKYVEKDDLHRGEYKKSENRVEMIDSQGKKVGVLFDTAPAYLTPKLMQELVEWTQEALGQEKYHPLLLVGNFLVEFLNIHPFTDGNGRLSRILTNLLMLQSGYAYMPYVSHEKLVENKKPAYYIALRKSQKTFNMKIEDLVPWLSFFFDTILEQSQIAIDLMSVERIDNILSSKQLAVWNYLDGVFEVSPGEIAIKTQVSRPTVNQVLTKLLGLKWIERLGQGRGTRYRKVRISTQP